MRFVYRKLFTYSISRCIPLRTLYYDGDRSVGRRSNTLQHRFIKYFEEAICTNMNSKINAKSSITTEQYIAANRQSISLISARVPPRKLSSIINQIEDLANVKDDKESKSQLSLIDQKSCQILERLTFDETLLLLNKLMEINPYRVASLKVYSESLRKLHDMISTNYLNSHKIVNFLFLASLKKHLAHREVNFVLKRIPDLGQLSLIEQCIVSVAAFKAGVKLNRNMILVIENSVHRNLDMLMEDQALFVSLIKALRYAGPSEEFSLTPISKKILETERTYDIEFAVPILALYTEMLKMEKNVVNKLVKDSISNLKKEINSTNKINIRIKDISRLLWAVSRLDYVLPSDELAEIMKFIDIKLQTYSILPKVFINTLFSLWMMGSSQCHQIVEYCFQENIFQPLLDTEPKHEAKLDLLVECVTIEAPAIKIPPCFIREIKEKPYKICEEIETVSELLKCFASHLALSDIKINCPVKTIRIYGISTIHRSLGRIHIDMLNNFTCLKDTREPNGFMSLKLRLVKGLGYYSILLDNDGVIRIEAMLATIEESINSMLRELEK